MRENAFMHILGGIVWGSKHSLPGDGKLHAVLPTKTSLWFIQFGGSAPSFSRALLGSKGPKGATCTNVCYLYIGSSCSELKA